MTIEDPRPRYVQVADLLRDEIRRGVHQPGDRLPSQPDLAKRFGLSQTSIGRAMAILRTGGLIRTEFGGGSYVLDPPTVKRVRSMPGASGGTPAGFAAQMRAAGLEPMTALDIHRDVEPPADVAALLALGDDERVLIRARRMYASGRAMQLATSYIPWSIGRELEDSDVDTHPRGLYEMLRVRGYGPVRFAEEVEVRKATESEQDFLMIPEIPSMVLEAVRIAIGPDERPVEVCINVLAASRWRLRYEWQA